MPSKPMSDAEGTFDESKPTKAENPDFRCRECGSDDFWYQTWDSNDGDYTDLRYYCRGWYYCRGCDRVWWIG